MRTRRFIPDRYVLGTNTGGKTWTIFRYYREHPVIVLTLECSQEMAQEVRDALETAAIRMRTRKRVPAIPSGKVPGWLGLGAIVRGFAQSTNHFQ